jgi:hypothetical protein
MGRTITEEEYSQVTGSFMRLGFHRGWVQELQSHADYRPDFGRKDPFQG